MSETSNDAAAIDGVNRRSMFGQLGAGAVGAVALGALAAGGLVATSTPAEAQGVTDNDILNFALNLEYLEAEFYLRAVTGFGLQFPNDIAGVGRYGDVTGGAQVPFRSTAISQYAQRLAVDEQNHVRFFRAVLGSAAVVRPAINFTDAFNTLARAAGLITASQTFNPFADDVSFLLGAFVFEDVGVTAFNGAARLIQNKDVLEAAVAVGLVEAYHAGNIRTLLANLGAGVAVNMITGLRGALGGGKEMGLTVPGLAYNAVATDSQSLAFRRTTREVLNVVYGAVNAPSGLFFPNGLNGTIVA